MGAESKGVAGGVTGGPGWRDVVIGVLVATLMTSYGGWLAFGKDTVRPDEVRALAESVAKLAATVGKLEITVAVLNDRLPRSTNSAAKEAP